MIRLAYPAVLLLLPALLAAGVWLWRRGDQRPRMAFSSVALVRGASRTRRMSSGRGRKFHHLPW